MLVWKDENKWKRGQGWPIFKENCSSLQRFSGLQTLGAETVVDVWLHVEKGVSDDVRGNQASELKSEPAKPKSKLKQEIKIEADDSKKSIASPDFDIQTTFIRCKDKEGGSFFLPVAVLPKNCQKKVDWNKTSVSPLKAHRQPPDHVLSVEHVSAQQQSKKSKTQFSNGQTDPSICNDRINNR